MRKFSNAHSLHARARKNDFCKNEIKMIVHIPGFYLRVTRSSRKDFLWRIRQDSGYL